MSNKVVDLTWSDQRHLLNLSRLVRRDTAKGVNLSQNVLR